MTHPQFFGLSQIPGILLKVATIHHISAFLKGLYQAEKKADYANSPATADLLVIVKKVDEMRRLTPQLMLDVKAIALPLIPPGNISLNTNHDTEIK